MSSQRSGSEGGGRQLALPVVEASQTGEARRVAVALGAELGFDETRRAELAIVVTEAATNLVKHARQGELLLRPLADGVRRGLEVLAVDRGPGLADVSRAVGDGFSTAGSPGTGLGAIRRLASAFDVHSLPGAGTTALAVLWSDHPPRAAGRSGGAQRAVHGGWRPSGRVSSGWSRPGRAGAGRPGAWGAPAEGTAACVGRV